MVITGGPGTGKTTIINAMLRIFAGMQTKILLAAPTGRAAKRMTEATGHEAKTIHRLLEYSFQKGGFQKNETAPLDCDLLIVDEASMIDILLMHHLLKAVPARATFVLVGDVNQLPSVGAGNVLQGHHRIAGGPRRRADRDLPAGPGELDHRQRPPDQPGADARTSRAPRSELDDFYFIEQEDPEKVLELIITLVKERIPKRFGFDPIDDIQVLTPMHRGIVGGMNLNVELQKALNPGEEGVSRMGRLYRVGDKVMQIANNYDKEVFNGDIGRIAAIDTEGQEVAVTIDGREVLYDFSELDELVPRLRRLDPQIPGLRVPGRGHPDPHPALHPPPAEPPLHRGHPGQEARRDRRDEEGAGHRHQEQQDREAVYPIERADECET